MNTEKVAPNNNHNNTSNSDNSNANEQALPWHRYQRQMMLPQLGYQGQQRLAKSRVAIVGMGGLGCPVAQYLVGAGVATTDEKGQAGQLLLIDDDVVSKSNLHRQILYQEDDVGKAKVVVAKDRLSKLNRQVHLLTQQQKINPNNIKSMLQEIDVIVDATDNFAISYLLSDYAHAHCKPLISASVAGVQGHIGVYCFDSHRQMSIPSLRAVFPNPPEVHASCQMLGVMGSSAGVMGSLQAQETLKVILADAAQLAGRLMYVDLWQMRQSVMNFIHAPEPQQIANIVSEQDLQENDVIIDVRTAEEVCLSPKRFSKRPSPHFSSKPPSSTHLAKTAINHIAMDELLVLLSVLTDKGNHTKTIKSQTAMIDRQEMNAKQQRLVLTCASGQRALVVADKALQAGYDKVAVWI